MANYKLGEWKSSTLSTLLFVKEQTDAGKKPKAKDIRNGTMMNWIYALKRGNYIIDNNGFELTDLGLKLLTELKHNPPKRTRKTTTRQLPATEKAKGVNQAQISIRSDIIAFDTLLPNDKAIKLINIITDMIKKS